MPEGRRFPFKFLPRRGVDLSITFGAPIQHDEIKSALTSSQISKLSPDHTIFSDAVEHESSVKTEQGWLGGTHVDARSSLEVERIRSLVTAIVQRRVEALGKEVAERTLKM